MDNLQLFIFLAVVGGVTAGYCSSYYDSSGRYRSSFSCPGLFDSSYKRYCCGTSHYKYCCQSGGTSDFWIGRTVAGLVIAGIGAVILVVILSCCCCAACPLYKRRQRGRVIANPGMTTVAPGVTTVAGTTVVYNQSSAPGMVNYGAYPNYPNAQPQPQGYGAPMPPSYAPAYPPPQFQAAGPPPYPATGPPPYPASGSPPYPAAGQPPAPANLYEKLHR